jgi:hypothetical protein
MKHKYDNYSDFAKHEIDLSILAYILKNPNAKDTLKGIIDWCLLEDYVRKQTTLVKKVLSELVNQGPIIEIQNINANLIIKSIKKDARNSRKN